MDTDSKTGDYQILYHDNVDNVAQEILIVDENEEENSRDVETVPCSVNDENQQPVQLQMPNTSEQFRAMQNNEIPNVVANNYIFQNPTQPLIAPENYVAKQGFKMDVDAEISHEVIVSAEEYETQKDKESLTLEFKDEGGTKETTPQNVLATEMKPEITIADSNNEPPRSSMGVEGNPITRNANTKTEPNPGTSSNIEETKKMREKKPVKGKRTKCEKRPCDSTVAGPSSGSVNSPGQIHVSCPYALTDLPRDIVLGKTVNGKKQLIARVRHINPGQTTTQAMKDRHGNIL